jgi:hypothetical protein
MRKIESGGAEMSRRLFLRELNADFFDSVCAFHKMWSARINGW